MKTSTGQGRGVSSGEAGPANVIRDDQPVQSQDAQRQHSLDRIDAALRRLDLGRFGHCLYCGDQISMVRLDEDPAVESCDTCNED